MARLATQDSTSLNFRFSPATDVPGYHEHPTYDTAFDSTPKTKINVRFIGQTYTFFGLSPQGSPTQQRVLEQNRFSRVATRRFVENEKPRPVLSVHSRFFLQFCPNALCFCYSIFQNDAPSRYTLR